MTSQHHSNPQWPLPSLFPPRPLSLSPIPSPIPIGSPSSGGTSRPQLIGCGGGGACHRSLQCGRRPLDVGRGAPSSSLLILGSGGGWRCTSSRWVPMCRARSSRRHPAVGGLIRSALGEVLTRLSLRAVLLGVPERCVGRWDVTVSAVDRAPSRQRRVFKVFSDTCKICEAISARWTCRV